MLKKYVLSITTLIMMLSVSLAQAHSPPPEAKIYFIGLTNGALVSSPLRLKFGIEGFGITPAGSKGKIRHTAGHHHLLLDLDDLPDMDEPIPHTANHIHFDKGETEAVLELSPGRHTLQLLLGDEEHEPQAPPLLSERISITVK
ncbi:MAG: DUF4399 domain-containing protein [Gammaproteobacteria bacterium]|nr:DUF4399 domain-containing protein [Gammaproteobacteria bacterium]MBL6998340.1 DUF4399 domain-containing protein [Gammaproteobacteria bacterium]